LNDLEDRYKKLIELYSDQQKPAIDSIRKGYEIEKLVNSLLRELASPLRQEENVVVGKKEFDGEIRIGEGRTIFYEIFSGNLSKFRYQSLLDLARTTRFPYKAYLLIIARSFSKKDKLRILELTEKMTPEGVKICFIDHKMLISLHRFIINRMTKYKDKDLIIIKRLFLLNLLERNSIIHKRFFDSALSSALNQYQFEISKPIIDYVSPQRRLISEESLQSLENMLNIVLHEIQDLRNEMNMINAKLLDFMKKAELYEIDLQKLEGKGDFPCPKCGNIIDPDDETEKAYKIIETKIKNGELAELVLVCGKCGSKIKLVGFMSSAQIPALKQIVARSKRYEKTLLKLMK
jgi:ribosomal protein S27AE